MKLNAPDGLGDAIYLRTVALHLLERGEALEIYTPWPEVFTGLPVKLLSIDEVEDGNLLEHAVACYHCQVPYVRKLTHFENVCQQAGVRESVALRIDWKVTNHCLIERAKSLAGGRKVLVYQPPKVASNPAEAALRPRREAFAKWLEKRDEFLVKVGSPKYINDGPDLRYDLDLVGQASIGEVFDLVADADMVFSETCFLIMLTQTMGKPLTLMCSREILTTPFRKIAGQNPDKLIHRKEGVTVVWDD